MTDTEKLTELSSRPVGRLLWRYSLPAVVGMLVMSLYNIIDRIYIGQGVGPEAIAGLAITFPVMNLSAALGVLIGAGGSARISILLGSKDFRGASRVLETAFVMQVCIVSIYLTVFAVFIDEILAAFGASEVTLPYARDFMLWILPGMMCTNFAFTFNNFMRVTGYPVKAMVTMFIGAALNLVLAPVFIFVLHWGIKGAAIATDISMAVSALWVMWHFFDRRNVLTLDRNFRWFTLPDMRVVGQIASIGAAPSLVNAAACFINVIINKSLYTYGGDVAVGAAGIFTSYTSLMTMVIVGLCQGMQPIVGYNYGAGLYHRLRSTYFQALAVATVIVALGQALGQSMPRYIARAFTTDPTLIDVTVNCLNIAMTAFWMVGLQVVSTTLFQSLGRAKSAIFLSLSRQVIFLIPLLLILPRSFGLDGVWMAFPISDCLATVVTLTMVVPLMRRLSGSSAAASIPAAEPAE